MYYVYKHIRLDKNEPFYIGVGTVQVPSAKTDKSFYSRAYTKKNRSRYWTNIVNKTDYKVEIIYKSNSYEEVLKKEKEFIKLYGRLDKNEGSLVNLTDGGEGTLNRTFKMSDKQKEKLSNIKSMMIYAYNLDGSFRCHFKNIKEAKTSLGVAHNAICSALVSKTNCTKNTILFREYKGDNLGYTLDINKPHPNSTPILLYNDIESLLFNNITSAAKYLNIDRKKLSWHLSKHSKYKEYNLVKMDNQQPNSV